MSNTISFITANYVARQVGYHMSGGWGQGDRTTNDYFRPFETFGARFAELLMDIRVLGFSAIDLWTSHLSPVWATGAHIDVAGQLLREYGIEVVALAGGFGSNREEFEATCRIASGVGTSILGGSTSMWEHDPDFVAQTLEQYGLRLGLENHPEKTPDALLERIGDGAEGRVGACVDTGWFGTQGYNAASALSELADQLLHVHIKDVRAAGAHDTCRFGEGIVPVRECIQTLKRIDYRGALAIEHEPEFYDPTDDIAASAAMLAGWLAEEH